VTSLCNSLDEWLDNKPSSLWWSSFILKIKEFIARGGKLRCENHQLHITSLQWSSSHNNVAKQRSKKSCDNCQNTQIDHDHVNHTLTIRNPYREIGSPFKFCCISNYSMCIKQVYIKLIDMEHNAHNSRLKMECKWHTILSNIFQHNKL
jgi:hypothetical protein